MDVGGIVPDQSYQICLNVLFVKLFVGCCVVFRVVTGLFGSEAVAAVACFAAEIL